MTYVNHVWCYHFKTDKKGDPPVRMEDEHPDLLHCPTCGYELKLRRT